MKKKIILILIIVMLILLATLGVSVAIFSKMAIGRGIVSVTSGEITFKYKESDEVDNGINIQDADPMSDALGKKLDNKFDFKIDANLIGSDMIYEVSVEPTSDSTINLDGVKIYIAEVIDGKEKELNSNLDGLGKIKDIGDYDNLIIHKERILKNTKNYEKNFRVRMWIDEDVDVFENGYLGEQGAFRINVVAKSDVNMTSDSIPIPKIIGGNETTWVAEPKIISLAQEETVIGGVTYEYYVTDDINDIPDDLTIATGITTDTYTVDRVGENYIYYRTVTSDGSKSAWSDKQTVLYDNNEYTITYNLNGGTQGENAITKYNVATPTFSLPTPTKIGYEFSGWYDNENFEGEPISKVDTYSRENKEYYAKWTLTNYTITYNLNGGIKPDKSVSSYTIETDTFDLPTPSKAGYTFKGWYEKSDFSDTQVKQITKGTIGNKIYYAKWILVNYTITYNLNGGIQGENAVNSYTFLSDTFKLPTPTKNEATFMGWYEKSDFSGNKVEEVAKGSTGNKTYYAKWHQEYIDVDFALDNDTFKQLGYTLAKEQKSGYLTTTEYTVKKGDDVVTDLVIPATYEYNGQKYRITGIKQMPSIESLIFIMSSVKSIKSVVLPNTITTIGNNAFNSFSDLEKINIPESVTYLGESAFQSCGKLTAITLPEGLTEIGNGTFSYCYKLASANVPSTVKRIGKNAFSSCSSLTSLTLPTDVTEIGESAFAYNINLASINIPNGIKTLPKSVFNGCKSLTELTIPDSVTSIGESAFSGCTSLASINIPSKLTKILPNSFRDCSSLTKLFLPETVTEIGNSAFSGCTSLASINIPSEVTKIGTGAFENCSSLQTVTLPEAVTAIGTSAFSGCTSLASINIPSKITKIDDNVFKNCSSLQTVTLPEAVTAIGTSTFSGCTKLSSINMSANITAIGSNAFYNCSSLTTLTLPSKLASIGDRAFNGCKELKKVVIPETVTSIGTYAFSSCTSLESINLPSKLTKIEVGTFYDCSSLTKLTVPETVTAIGTSAFENCKNLTSINIPSKVTKINPNTFSNCWSITSITIPSGVTEIGNYAFYNMDKLKAITIPSKVAKIGDYAFSNSDIISTVTIPESVTSIGADAFNGCGSLATVYIKPTNVIFGTNCFSYLKGSTNGYGSTIYVKSADIRNKLLENQKDREFVGTTTETDYITIKNVFMGTTYYTEVSTNYNWK